MAATRRLFFLLSKIAVATYGRFPIFGHLRSAVGVIRQQGRFLMIDRSDGHGLGFPGGLSWPWEADEQTMRREVREETGLQVQSARLLFRYRDEHYIPGFISVYEVEATGKVRGSWEGEPVWCSLADITAKPFASHAQIVQFLGRNPQG